MPSSVLDRPTIIEATKTSTTMVYARVVSGKHELWCPDCGTFISQKGGVIVRIACKHCGSVFYWGSILYRPAPGAKPTPPDVVQPLFAELHPDRIRKGQPVNRLRQLNDDGSWTEIIPAPKVPKP